MKRSFRDGNLGGVGRSVGGFVVGWSVEVGVERREGSRRLSFGDRDGGLRSSWWCLGRSEAELS